MTDKFTPLKPHPFDELLETVGKILRILSPIPFADLTLHPEKPEATLKTDEIPQTGKSASAPLQSQTNPPHRILVVDDDANTCLLNAEILIRHGYEVNTAKDGAAGWEALQAGNYDLVITDNKMPRMTGIEMIEKLRAAHMAVPVIMATGSLPMREFARKPWLKPDAMLLRPFPNDDLLEAVQKVLLV
jgi:two-component system sensor histidine kinase and response regulator WspE